MRRNTIVLGLVLFILAIFAWAGWANYEYRKQQAARQRASMPEVTLIPDQAADPIHPLQGKTAPGFTLTDLSGAPVSLADYKGKAVLINFWATWCGPCRLETPWIVELRNQYAAKGFEVLGVSTDDIDRGDPAKFNEEKNEIAGFARKMHINYPVLIDGDKLSRPYGGLDSLPTSFYVNRQGIIVVSQMGVTSKDDMEADIKKALGM